MMKSGIFLGAALMLAPATAQAAVTVTDYQFTNNFAIGLYPTLSGTFSLSHDSDTGVYALTALHYEIEGFVHDASNSSLWSFSDQDGDFVVLYGNVNDRQVSYHTKDFDFAFRVGGNVSSSVYSTDTSYVIPAGFSVVETVGAPNAPAVPESATWAMMIAGFGMAGALLRQRRLKPSLAF